MFSFVNHIKFFFFFISSIISWKIRWQFIYIFSCRLNQKIDLSCVHVAIELRIPFDSYIFFSIHFLCTRKFFFFSLIKQIANFIYANNDHVQKRMYCECVNILFSLWGRRGQEMCTKHVTLILSMITSQAVLLMKIRNEKKKMFK